MSVRLWNQDCIAGLAERVVPESVDLTVTSIPFASLFQYSGKTEDVGNSPDAGLDFVGSQFGLHMRFVIEQLLRVHRPGTLCCIHVQQLITYAIQHGFQGRRDFRGAVVDLFAAGGFDWHAEVAIPKNPQVIAQRQKLHSLLFVTGKRDARGLAPAVCDYLLIFKKPGQAAPVPAVHDARTNPDGWVTTDEWIRWARGVWDDIRETDVLENWREGKADEDERHVCPLQLEVVRRLVRLYSNPGETVLDPFVGVGSTAVVAIEQGRDALGFELKTSYFEQAQKQVARALEARTVERRDLFAWAGVEVAG